MSTSNFQYATKVLTKELKDKGYSCRLDSAHSHPRLYVMCEGIERFTILSSTGNYAEGKLLSMKRQDIVRDVLPLLPIPNPVTLAKQTSGVSQPPPSNPVKGNKVFSISAYIAGKGGMLVVILPEEAIPEKARLAQIANFGKSDDPERRAARLVRLGIIFSPDNGVAPGAGPGRGTSLAYYFSREKVPFNYARHQPIGFKAPKLCARLMGDSLVCDEPLPMELIEDVEPQEVVPAESSTTGKSEPKEEFKLKDGGDLRKQINRWVVWAKSAGYDPTLIITKGKLHISVVTKVTKEL